MKRPQPFPWRPRNPGKYKGNPNNIIARSSWEVKFMVWLDNNNDVLEWQSEEIIIPYISPKDNRIHRYFPDFYAKIKNTSGITKTYVIEIKPKAQTKEPVNPGRITKRFIQEVVTWGVNKSKWEAATSYCLDRGMEFLILTEEHLKI